MGEKYRSITSGQATASGGGAAKKGALLVLVSAASFGVMPILAKLAYQQQVNINTLLALRFSIAAVAMWLLWGWQLRRGAAQANGVGRSRLAGMVAMGALGYVGQSFSYFQAVSILTATATGLLLYTYPIIVTLLAWAIFRDPLTPRKVGALVTATTGALLVLGVGSLVVGGGIISGAGLHPTGVMWAAAASLIYSAYILAGTRFTVGVHPVFSSAVVISSAAVVYVGWGLLSGGLNLALSVQGWLYAAAIAVLSTVVAIVAFFAGLSLIGPSKAAIISTMEPAVTVALAALVLGERMRLDQALGGALILASVLVLQMRERPAPEAARPSPQRPTGAEAEALDARSEAEI